MTNIKDELLNFVSKFKSLTEEETKEIVDNINVQNFKKEYYFLKKVKFQSNAISF